MPGVSSSLRVSKDGQYIMATGIYKPRIKCFDVNNLSLKFERCLDSEVITFEILSEDYAKVYRSLVMGKSLTLWDTGKLSGLFFFQIVFLQCDRYVEFHVGHGRHYRLRVPRFGRDISYHKPSCDLFVVGASSVCIFIFYISFLLFKYLQYIVNFRTFAGGLQTQFGIRPIFCTICNKSHRSQLL